MPVLTFPSTYIDDKAASELPSVVIAHIHGEADPARLSEIAAQDLAYRDFLYAMSIMCSPDNLDEAVRLNHALTAGEIYHATHHLSEIDIDGSMNSATALFMADREDPKEILHALIENDWLGHIASGYILRFIVSRWQNMETRDSASLASAASSIEEWCSKNAIYGGKQQNVTRNIWKKYQGVSHLWAAWQMMLDAEINPTTPAGFMIFCGTAQWLLEQGAAIVPKGRRAGETLLALGDAWAIPESHLNRMPDGSIGTRIWSDDPEAHDIRSTGAPPSHQRV